MNGRSGYFQARAAVSSPSTATIIKTANRVGPDHAKPAVFRDRTQQVSNAAKSRVAMDEKGSRIAKKPQQEERDSTFSMRHAESVALQILRYSGDE